MWGQERRSARITPTTGIIPTRVGTSNPPQLFRRSWRDHPHACGDKCLLTPNNRPCLGSSPRVWGQAFSTLCRRRGNGIIPTRVGTSEVVYVQNGIEGDHPHACGDKRTLFLKKKPLKGSSPRVWGQEDDGEYELINFRIIPTRVGTSSCNKCIDCCVQDHPHACGDKTVSVSSPSIFSGSSPRVWGQGKKVLTRKEKCGIIPTRVGTRGSKPFKKPIERDHPHACGDKKVLK